MKKVVLITGASRGIGRASAQLFAHAGYRVAINYRQSRETAENLAASLQEQGFAAMAVAADVSCQEQVQTMAAKITTAWGGIDVLINNAGIAQQKLFTDITPADWQRMFDIHVMGAFHCCQAVLPGMLHQKDGRILNVSSIWGLTGASCEVHYSAAKAALIGMTKALAKELGPSHITVNCVAPGVTDTDMNAHLDRATLAALKEETPLGSLGTPEDVAHALFFLASEEASFITGQIISPNGGMVI